MRNFLLLCLQVGFVFFVLAAVIGFINYFFGLKLGFKGAEVPADPVIAGLLLVMGFVSGGIFLFLNRNTGSE